MKVHPLTEPRCTASVTFSLRSRSHYRAVQFYGFIIHLSDNFSVTQQVTCSLKCDLLGHILASEAISAKGEKRKFWLLCWLLFSFFLIRFFIGQMFLIGIHHISGTCEDARKESMIEVFPVVMVAYGAPEQSIHFLGNAFAVTIPDCIKQSISIPLLRTVIEPLMICW